MFVSEYFGLGDEFDKKEIFDCILDKDSPFFIKFNAIEGMWYSGISRLISYKVKMEFSKEDLKEAKKWI